MLQTWGDHVPPWIMGNGMATEENETGKITCPCCQTTLVIDRETLSILYVTEHREKAGGASFEEALRELKTKEMQKGSRFQQAVDEEKQRRALLGKKFQELQKKAAAEPDAPPPPRPFDFE
jgi:adenine-specific DNA methylase